MSDLKETKSEIKKKKREKKKKNKGELYKAQGIKLGQIDGRVTNTLMRKEGERKH